MRVGRSAGIGLAASVSARRSSLLFPLREGDVIGVLHKTVTDWLTGEAPFDGAVLERSFQRVPPHAGVCHRHCWSSEANASDAAAAVTSFVEGEGGAAADAYALRWCLFHELDGLLLQCGVAWPSWRETAARLARRCICW